MGLKLNSWWMSKSGYWKLETEKKKIISMRMLVHKLLQTNFSRWVQKILYLPQATPSFTILSYCLQSCKNVNFAIFPLPSLIFELKNWNQNCISFELEDWKLNRKVLLSNVRNSLVTIPWTSNCIPYKSSSTTGLHSILKT